MDRTAVTSVTKPADALPAHLNTVLVQIGRIFQHSTRPDSKANSRPRSQAIEALTKANRQFHETLDEVEIELLNAKAVLERDLSAIRAKRAERENALRTEKLKQAGKEASQKTTNKGIKIEQPSLTVKDEMNTNKSSLAPKLDTEKKTDPNKGTRAVTNTKEANTSGQEDVLSDMNTAAVVLPTPQELKDLGAAGDIFSDSLGTSNFTHIPTDADFDSMFNDPSGNGTESLDFNLDFTNTNSIGDGLPTNNAVGTVSSIVDVGNLEATSSEDINSVLPGLENYLDADGDGGLGDFSMLDVPVDGNLIGTSAAGTQQSFGMPENVSQANTTGANTTTAEEASFDDLLFGSDTLDMGGMGNIENGDFDDFFAE